MKATPKSCSCEQCKYAKHTKTGNFFIKKEKRAFRHQQKVSLRRGDDALLIPAGNGSRFG